LDPPLGFLLIVLVAPWTTELVLAQNYELPQSAAVRIETIQSIEFYPFKMLSKISAALGYLLKKLIY